MDNEFKITISNHNFNEAKKQLKQFSEQDAEKLKFDKVRTHEEFLGFEYSEHGVTGKEFNELVEKIQSYLSKFYDKQQILIKEFGEVYKALEALDKDYIQAILTSVEAVNKTNQRILKQQERIDKTIENQKVTLQVLKKFKDQLSDPDKSQQSQEVLSLIKQLEKRVMSIEVEFKKEIQILDINSEIDDLKQELDKTNGQLQEVASKLTTLYIISGISIAVAVVTLFFSLLG